jgi:streptomycin 6-kinase
MRHSASEILRSRLRSVAATRGIDLHGPSHETRAAIGSRGVWRGREIYVKAMAPDSDERRAAELLRAWSDGPVVRVLDADDDVVVLEWLEPGCSLESQYDAPGDDASLVLLADIAGTLARLGVPHAGFPSAGERGASLLERARPACVEHDLWHLARERYLALAKSQSTIGVVHGDLHHANVLAEHSRSWVVIDPKGVAAELEFELACALRNPIARHRQWADAECVSRRATLVAQRAGVDPFRLLGWAFAQCILAAAWEVEDGLDPAPWLVVGRAFAAADLAKR